MKNSRLRRWFPNANLGLSAPGVFSTILIAQAVTLAYWRIILPYRSERISANLEVLNG